MGDEGLVDVLVSVGFKSIGLLVPCRDASLYPLKLLYFRQSKGGRFVYALRLIASHVG